MPSPSQVAANPSDDDLPPIGQPLNGIGPDGALPPMGQPLNGIGPDGRHYAPPSRQQPKSYITSTGHTVTELPDDVQLDGIGPDGKYYPPPSQQQQSKSYTTSNGYTVTELPDDVQLDGIGPDGNYYPPVNAQDPSMARNFITGLMRVPGAILGTAHMLGHTGHWAEAQLFNGLDELTGGPGNHTGAELDNFDPVMSHALPTSEGVDRTVFGVTGVKPYQPQTDGGEIGQAATTAGAAMLLDPAADFSALKTAAPILKRFLAFAKAQAPAVAKGAVSGAAADAAHQVAPDSPGLAAAAAFLAHAGASSVGAASHAGSGVGLDATRQIFSPAQQGETEAGRVLRSAANTGPGLASPSDADLANATGAVKATTDAIGPGQQPWQAGAELRSGLQSRADALKAARSASADRAFETFRAQPPLPARELAPFMQSPSFKRALTAANGAALDEGLEPLTKYFQFGENDTPTYLSGEAIPPDVLQRIKSNLSSAAGNAPVGSPEARTAGILDKRFGDFLDAQYPATQGFPGYAAIRHGYADASRPLDTFAYGPVGKTLDAEKQFGQSRYVMPDERIPDLFLRSKATKADLDHLVAANGGDRTSALGALQDHLAAVAQSAVRSDGTLDGAAFDRAMRPYQQSLGNVGMWFPELDQKFNSARQAQASLETLQAQRGLADAVRGGALRDSDGAVTATSLGKWLQANSDAIGKTQSPAATMRLQSIADALQNSRPGELADALKAELLPAAIGMATGGPEGGVFGVLLHKTGGGIFRSLDQKRQAAFSAAMEQAVLDPAYASRLADAAAKQGNGVRPVRALARAVAATPLAVNAGQLPSP